MEYCSCDNIRNGFNIYRSGKITACCMQIDPELEIAHIDDKNVTEKILIGQNGILRRHKRGDLPAGCQRCANLVKREWPEHFEEKFYNIQLNHYRSCNLRCRHCGYRSTDPKLSDTPHELVLPLLNKCIEVGICDSKLLLEVGGGEPSLAPELENLLEIAIDRNWSAIINSNGAKFSEIFARGVNSGLFTLLLTPDAGSPETFKAIKGVDNFANTWRNIGRYMAKTEGKALVKFILETGNIHDIPAMIESSRKYGVKNTVISLDMNIPKAEHEFYAKKVAEFTRLAKKNGLAVIRGAFLPPILT